jgi:hypothetical protein
MSEQTWTIKPLEWRREPEDLWSAETVFGPYTVLYSLGRWYWTNEDWNPCDSLDAGKLAAEAHYRERLSQALTPSPPEDGLREAVDLKALAAEIADDLFTAGNNVKAGRLVLEPMDKRGDLGGWIESAVKLVIERHLAAALGGKE